MTKKSDDKGRAKLPDIDLDAPPPPCPHPEHRLGTNGRLRKHQRVCMQCGAVVPAPR